MSSSSSSSLSSSIIEHVLLFKLNDDAQPSDAEAMASRINGLISIDQVLTIAAGPLRRFRSSSSAFKFTHFLHSRYASKADLAAYAVHPSHVSVVTLNAPVVSDVLALDWAAAELRGPAALPPGSAARVALLKLKQGLGDEAKMAVLDGIREIEEGLVGGNYRIGQFTAGENFSPERAKGFSVGFLAVFPSVGEMDSAEDWSHVVEEKLKDYLDCSLVVEFEVPLLQESGSTF